MLTMKQRFFPNVSQGPVALLLALGASGCSGDATPDTSVSPDVTVAPDQPGPYAVGVRFTEVWDPDREISVPVTIWYPAGEAPGDSAWSFARGVEGAPAADGDGFPVVLYSHGNIEVPEASVFLADHLSSHGYVVAAPAHPYDTLNDYDPERAYDSTMYRTRDIPLTLDLVVAANADPEDGLFGEIDTETVGMVGHSWGATTTEVLSGWAMSGGPPEYAEAAAANGFSWPLEAKDDRIKAGISMATCMADLFDPSGWDGIDIPMLYVGGTADDWCNVDVESQKKADWTASAELIRVEGATHYSFTNMCDIDPAPPEFYQCVEPPRAYGEVQAITNTVVTDFLGLHLLGDDNYGAALEQGTY